MMVSATGEVMEEKTYAASHKNTNNNDSSLTEAVSIVQAIFNEVTLNDYPPCNDEIGSAKRRHQHDYHQQTAAIRITRPRSKNNIKSNSKPPLSHRKENHLNDPMSASSTTSTSMSTSYHSSMRDSAYPPSGVGFTPQQHISPTNSLDRVAGGDDSLPTRMNTNQFDYPSSPVDNNSSGLNASFVSDMVSVGESTLSSNNYNLCISPNASGTTSSGSLILSPSRSSEMKMGNTALATLCTRTLNSMTSSHNVAPVPSVDINVEQGNSIHQLHDESNDNDSLLDIEHNSEDENGITTSSPRGGKIRSPKNWLKGRRRRKKQQQQKYDQFTDDNTTIQIPNIEEKKAESDYDGAKENNDVPMSPKTPLHSNTKKRTTGSHGHFLQLDFSGNKNTSSPEIIQIDSVDSATSENNYSIHLGDVLEKGVSKNSDVVDVDSDLMSPTSTSKDLEHIPEENVDEDGDGKDEVRSTSQFPIGKPGSAASTQLSLPQSTSGRIQMFGSEYARFLSSTPFAPTIKTKRTRTGRLLVPRHSKGSTKQQQQLQRQSQRDHLSVSSSASPYTRALPPTTTNGRTINIEDAKDSILTGAITDIIVTHGNDLPPRGYYRISQTGSGDDFTTLSRQSGRKTTQVYLNVKKEANWDRAAQRPCVTSLAIIFPDRKEFVPPGFSVVRCYEGQQSTNISNAKDNNQNAGSSGGDPTGSVPANLNFGSSGERVYVCYRRSREGNPITGIIPLQPLKGETIPEGYTVLERTPRNFVADINSKNGPPLFLAFRQRLANLETLRPLPLVLSVHYSNPPTINGAGSGSFEGADVASSTPSLNKQQQKKKRLRAYYCTGGTVVPSEVGLFHIMDRSTHSLLSPSSISNRLSLIEASRKNNISATNDSDLPKSSIPTASTYASSVDADSLDGQENSGRFLSSDSRTSSGRSENALFPDDDTLEESFTDRFGTPNTNNSHHHSVGSMSDLTGVNPHNQIGLNISDAVLSHAGDSSVQSCLAAMEFIPTIDTSLCNITTERTSNQKELLEVRIAILTPILTACYTYHGGSAVVAVEGLTSLLAKSDFFNIGIIGSAEMNKDASTRLTLLDLATQVVCDVATSSSRETIFFPCIEFVSSAMRLSRGGLNTRTVGYVLRFYLFVFYFGANFITTSSSSWPNPRREDRGTAALSNFFPVVSDDIFLLYEDTNSKMKSNAGLFLPGGSPQVAALALKELVTLTAARLQHADVGKGTDNKTQRKENLASDKSSLLADFSSYAQLALHQVHRSGGSELFWHDMITSCGAGLFQSDQSLQQEGKYVYALSFSVLANIVKIASSKVRKTNLTSEILPRDVANKLLSLELLQHFLKRWGREHSKKASDVQSDEAIAYAVRRLVVPCLLWNTGCGLEESRVFRRIMCIVSELWCTPYYRRHMKVEIGILIEHFVVRLLGLGPQLLPPNHFHDTEAKVVNSSAIPLSMSKSLLSQQVDILSELQRWFMLGRNDMVEIFLNYDLNYSPTSGSGKGIMSNTQQKVTQDLLGALCNIADIAGDKIGEQVRMSQSTGVGGPPSPAGSNKDTEKVHEMTVIREGSRLLQQNAFESISRTAKSIAESAVTVSGKRYRLLFSSWSASDNVWSTPDIDSDAESNSESDDDASLTSTAENFPSVQSPRIGIGRRWGNQTATTPKEDSDNDSIVSYWQNEIAPERRKATPNSLSDSRNRGTSARANRETCEDDCSEMPRIPAQQELRPDAEEKIKIAFEFDSLKKAIEYLIACNVLTTSARDIASFLRIHQDRLDPAVLGQYLGEKGEDDTDAATKYRNLIRFNYFRAISFVGMNIEQGLRYFLTNCGFHLPGEAQMIDRIMATFSQCYWEDNAGDARCCPFRDQDTVFLLSFAIIMLNTDLHKCEQKPRNRRKSIASKKKMTKAEFINNLRGVDNAEELSASYLSQIYDSIEEQPIIAIMNDSSERDNSLHNASSASLADKESSRPNDLTSMIKNVKASEELLRGLSAHPSKFYSFAVFGSGRQSLGNLTRQTMRATWHHYHAVINSALDRAHLDTQGMVYCLDVLKYSLCVTICLDMTMERSAFVTQLARFKLFSEYRDISDADDECQEEEWYVELERAGGTLDDEGRLSALKRVNSIIEHLRSLLTVDASIKKDMQRIVRRIQNGGFLLNDPSRFIVREGELTKRSNRSGRNVKYHFFLFSDVLIYAKKETPDSDEYKIHSELPLHLMKVVDYFPSSSRKSKTTFQIYHPVKNLLLLASSVEERKEWVSELNTSIENEVIRKIEMENARIKAASPLSVDHNNREQMKSFFKK